MNKVLLLVFGLIFAVFLASLFGFAFNYSRSPIKVKFLSFAPSENVVFDETIINLRLLINPVTGVGRLSFPNSVNDYLIKRDNAVVKDSDLTITAQNADTFIEVTGEYAGKPFSYDSTREFNPVKVKVSPGRQPLTTELLPVAASWNTKVYAAIQLFGEPARGNVYRENSAEKLSSVEIEKLDPSTFSARPKDKRLEVGDFSNYNQYVIPIKNAVLPSAVRLKTVGGKASKTIDGVDVFQGIQFTVKGEKSNKCQQCLTVNLTDGKLSFTADYSQIESNSFFTDRYYLQAKIPDYIAHGKIPGGKTLENTEESTSNFITVSVPPSTNFFSSASITSSSTVCGKPLIFFENGKSSNDFSLDLKKNRLTGFEKFSSAKIYSGKVSIFELMTSDLNVVNLRSIPSESQIQKIVSKDKRTYSYSPLRFSANSGVVGELSLSIVTVDGSTYDDFTLKNAFVVLDWVSATGKITDCDADTYAVVFSKNVPLQLVFNDVTYRVTISGKDVDAVLTVETKDKGASRWKAIECLPGKASASIASGEATCKDLHFKLVSTSSIAGKSLFEVSLTPLTLEKNGAYGLTFFPELPDQKIHFALLKPERKDVSSKLVVSLNSQKVFDFSSNVKDSSDLKRPSALEFASNNAGYDFSWNLNNVRKKNGLGFLSTDPIVDSGFYKKNYVLTALEGKQKTSSEQFTVYYYGRYLKDVTFAKKSSEYAFFSPDLDSVHLLLYKNQPVKDVLAKYDVELQAYDKQTETAFISIKDHYTGELIYCTPYWLFKPEYADLPVEFLGNQFASCFTGYISQIRDKPMLKIRLIAKYLDSKEENGLKTVMPVQIQSNLHVGGYTSAIALEITEEH